MKYVSIVCLTVFAVVTLGSGELVAQEKVQEFKGKVAREYENSKEWWPRTVTPPEGAPKWSSFCWMMSGLRNWGSRLGD